MTGPTAVPIPQSRFPVPDNMRVETLAVHGAHAADARVPQPCFGHIGGLQLAYNSLNWQQFRLGGGRAGRRAALQCGPN